VLGSSHLLKRKTDTNHQQLRLKKTPTEKEQNLFQKNYLSRGDKSRESFMNR
jgi:hypothetical protein